MAKMVTLRGGKPLIFPTIETRFAVPAGQVESFKNDLSSSSWIVVTSVSSAKFLLKILGDRFQPVLSRRKIGAVGRKTAGFLESKGVSVHIVPEEANSESLGRILVETLKKEDVVFFPRAREGRRELIEALEENGLQYFAPVLYETTVPKHSAEAIREVLETPVGYASFTSPSSFRNFVEIAGKESSDSFFKNVRIAVIGNTTAACVRELGFQIAVLPEYPVIEGLLDAISADITSTAMKEEG